MGSSPALAALLPQARGLLLCGHTPPPSVLSHEVRAACCAALCWAVLCCCAVPLCMLRQATGPPLPLSQLPSCLAVP